MSDLIAKAYQATKLESDPDYPAVAQQFKDTLTARADAVVKTGVTQTPFEREYKKLYAEQMEDQENGPLATDSAPSSGGALDRQTLPDKEAEEAPIPAKKSEVKKVDTNEGIVEQTANPNAKSEALHAMSRAELDAEAKKLNLNPDDYKNRDEILKAIEAKQVK